MKVDFQFVVQLEGQNYAFCLIAVESGASHFKIGQTRYFLQSSEGYETIELLLFKSGVCEYRSMEDLVSTMRRFSIVANITMRPYHSSFATHNVGTSRLIAEQCGRSQAL